MLVLGGRRPPGRRGEYPAVRAPRADTSALRHRQVVPPSRFLAEREQLEPEPAPCRLHVRDTNPHDSSPESGHPFSKADEATSLRRAVSSEFATILDGKDIKARRRLFMTATPRYFTGRVVRAARRADFEVASMDDRQSSGRCSTDSGSARRSSVNLLNSRSVPSAV